MGQTNKTPTKTAAPWNGILSISVAQGDATDCLPGCAKALQAFA